jgi:hypothetical protein
MACISALSHSIQVPTSCKIQAAIDVLLFSPSVEICLGITVFIAMRTLLGLKTLGWAGLGFGVIVPFDGLLLHGFGMGFVR